MLSGSLRKAVANRIIPSNPASHVKRPVVESSEVVPLIPDEVQAIAGNVPERHRSLVMVPGYGGLRVGEAIALRRRSVDVAARELTISESASDVNGHIEFVTPKSGKARTVMMPAFLASMMDVHLDVYVAPEPEALVFTGTRGGVLRANNWRTRTFYPAVNAAGIERRVRIHDLRHTCASLLIQAGMHPKIVQDHLGHSSIAVTMDRYGHLYASDRAKAADALDDVFQNALNSQR